jgi:hypothetical protein
VTITYGSDVTGFDAVRFGRGMPRAPVPFCGCGGTPHGRGSFAERTVSGGRLSGRGKGVAKQAGVATGGPLFTLCTKRGVGTWGRRNLSGTVSVTWRSVPGGCRRRARLVLTVVPVGPGFCWLFLFGAKDRRVKGKWDGRGSLTAGRNGPGRKGESGKAGVPSRWEGTGQEEKEKAGKPGFPRNGRKRARKKWRKRESRGSLAMGGNGPGRKGESGKAGVPSQWKGTGQEEKEKAGKPGFPRNGRERARKKKEKAGSQLGRKRSRSRFWSGTRSENRIGIGMSSAGSARSFCCLGRAMVGLRAAGDS